MLPGAHREWQQAAYRTWLQSDRKDFLLVGTPGSGKTRFGLLVSATAREHGLFVVVVVPSEHLTKQWQAAAELVGLAFEVWPNTPHQIPADLNGIVVTYQQVVANPELHRKLTSQRRTTVIFDEIHHAGDQRTWGRALRLAYEHARERLLLSGTPFRSDGGTIPFIRYDERGECIADVRYTYTQALADGICRPITFETFEGHLAWLDNGQEVTSSLGESVNERVATARLRVALDPRMDWLKNVLSQADARLESLRRDADVPDAGGLVLASDIAHAYALAELLRPIARETPSIAVSDEPKASEEISRFAKGTGKWLIAVRMVSEGVDIPRLRIGVYASRITTTIFFHQFCGRFVRRSEVAEDTEARIFIPKTPELSGLAQSIEAEVDAHLRGLLAALEGDEQGGGGRSGIREIIPLEGLAYADDVISHAAIFSPVEMREAETYLARLPQGARVARETVAHLMRLFRAGQPIYAGAEETAPPTRRDERRQLREWCKKLTGECAYRTGREFKDINVDLARLTGARIQESTLDQLRQRYSILQRWLAQPGT